MAGNQSKGWIRGALLLAFAGLFSKVLSAGYRIPLQNLTGDMGFYIYQQVYPLLGMALVLSLYGFPSAISKMAADLKQEGKQLSKTYFYLPILLLLSLIAGSMALLLFLNAEQLAVWIGDPALVKAYQLVALSFVIIPFTSLLRGFFQGAEEMKPTAYSQVGEQLIRVVLILFAAIYVASFGGDLYLVGEGAAAASLVGGVTAFLILLFFIRKKEKVQVVKQSIPWKYYVQMISLFGLVASLNHMILLLLQFADAFTLIPALTEYGLSQTEAKEAKGILDRGQPLIQLGTVLGSSFALAMIPAISVKKLKENTKQFYEQMHSSLAIGFYLAVGATFGLIAIMPKANILLFADEKGTSDLRILVTAILLSSLIITAVTILQSLGYIKRTALFITAAIFVKWFGNQLLVPWFGITGSALATVISLLLLFTVVVIELRRKLPALSMRKQIKWSSLGLAVLSMLLFIFIVNLFIPMEMGRAGALFYVLLIVSGGAAIYFFILLRGRTFTEKEISMLPLARVWIDVYKERV